MLDRFEARNFEDEEGNPSGGEVRGTGLYVNWQQGPLGRGEDRQEPDGAFVETVIAAAKQRLEFYQTAANGKFACEENRMAIVHLETALGYMNLRTQQREERGVEGTHEA